MWIQEHEDKIYNAIHIPRLQVELWIQLCFPLQQQSISKYNTNLKHDN